MIAALLRRAALLCLLLGLAGTACLPARASAPPPQPVPLAIGEAIDQAVATVGRWQSRLNRALATEVGRIKRGEGMVAVMALLALGFGYGVVHALGPGHGKAVVAAYFMDRTRHWTSAIFAGSWIAIGHTISAIVIVLLLALAFGGASLDVMDQARTVEAISYGLIAAIGLWRLWAGIRGDPHCHAHCHAHGHDHGHGHSHDAPAGGHGHKHDRGEAPGIGARLRQFLRPDAMLGMLTAAAAVPCSGSMILLLFALANGLLWVGLFATLSITLGMGLTLIVLGFTAVALRTRFVDRGGHPWLQRAMTIAGGLLVAVVGVLMLAAVLDRPL